MILPPKTVSEFLVFREATSWEYEVFVFSHPLTPILEGYESGKGISKEIADGVKSYIFEGREEITPRFNLVNWMTGIGMQDAEDAVNKCRSWRLVHCIVPGYAFQTGYQGHPIRLENWARIATPVHDRGTKKRVDMFDPLQFVEEMTFSLDEHLRSFNG